MIIKITVSVILSDGRYISCISNRLVVLRLLRTQRTGWAFKVFKRVPICLNIEIFQHDEQSKVSSDSPFKLGIALSTLRVTLNYAYSPFKFLNLHL